MPDQIITEQRIQQESSFPKNPLRILFFEIFLFSLTFILGISSARKLSRIIVVQKIEATPSFYTRLILTTFFIVLIIFLVIKFVKSSLKKKVLLKAFFLLATVFGSFIFFVVWLQESWALILVAILVFSWIKKPNIFLHDLLLVSGMTGASIILGTELNPTTVIYLLILFSIYDIIAVYKTKHMVKMAKAMNEAGALPGLILPSRISDFSAPIENNSPDRKFLILGSGDIVFPLLLSISIVEEGVLKSIIVAFFALFGLLASFWIFFQQKERKAIPALPSIALFSIIGYLITLLFKS